MHCSWCYHNEADYGNLPGAWALRWKAWMRCSPNSDFDQLTAPGDPLMYVNKDFNIVKDFVRSWELVSDFHQLSEGRLLASSPANEGKGEVSKRALDTTDRAGPANARRRA